MNVFWFVDCSLYRVYDSTTKFVWCRFFLENQLLAVKGAWETYIIPKNICTTSIWGFRQMNRSESERELYLHKVNRKWKYLHLEFFFTAQTQLPQYKVVYMYIVHCTSIFITKVFNGNWRNENALYLFTLHYITIQCNGSPFYFYFHIIIFGIQSVCLYLNEKYWIKFYLF